MARKEKIPLAEAGEDESHWNAALRQALSSQQAWWRGLGTPAQHLPACAFWLLALCQSSIGSCHAMVLVAGNNAMSMLQEGSVS